MHLSFDTALCRASYPQKMAEPIGFAWELALMGASRVIQQPRLDVQQIRAAFFGNVCNIAVMNDSSRIKRRVNVPALDK